MSKEAMRLALEALELMYACYAHPEWISHKQQEEKILAQCAATTMTLRQALAKQEHVAEPHKGEPVACANGCSKFFKYTTTPQQRKPLTDKMLNIIASQWHMNLLVGKDKADVMSFARAIEAAHSIKG